MPSVGINLGLQNIGDNLIKLEVTYEEIRYERDIIQYSGFRA